MPRERPVADPTRRAGRPRRGAGSIVSFSESNMNEVRAYAARIGLKPNQSFAGVIGLDFDVLSPIVVTKMGLWDSGGRGIAQPSFVRIYDRQAGTSVVEVTLQGTSSPLTPDGYRMAPVPGSFILPAGFQGAVVALVTAAPIYNDDMGAVDPGNTTNDGGLIAFRGLGRFGTDPQQYPTSIVTHLTRPNPFIAGNFAFRAVGPVVTTVRAARLMPRPPSRAPRPFRSHR